MYAHCELRAALAFPFGVDDVGLRDARRSRESALIWEKATCFRNGGGYGLSLF